jgi:hypothetical protein
MTSLRSADATSDLTNEQLCLPAAYQAATTPRLGKRCPATMPEMSLAPFYDFAEHLRQFSGLPCVIDIGCPDASLLTDRFSPEQVAVLGGGKTIADASRFLPRSRLFVQNLQHTLSLPPSLLKHSIVLCADLIHRLPDPRPLLESLCQAAQVAPFVILGTPERLRNGGPFHLGPAEQTGDLRHWRLDELVRLLETMGAKVARSGYVGPWGLAGAKPQSLVLMGSHCLTTAAPAKRVVSLVSCFNDIDIIEHCYQHLKEQGVAAAFIDNWSSDGTWELIEKWRKEEPNACVHAERFPVEGPTQDYEWAGILDRKAALAQQLNFDWFIHYDSDEIRESPIAGTTLASAISRIDQLGYTAIDHTVLDFRPILDGFDGSQDPKSYFRFFEFGDRVDHFMQIKGWKRQKTPVDLLPLGGHVAFFDSPRVYPLKFLLRHYSTRSSRHAKLKYHQHRFPRIQKEIEKFRWHTHLQAQYTEQEKSKFTWDARKLISFSNESDRMEFLLQYICGLGINDEARKQALQRFTRT